MNIRTTLCIEFMKTVLSIGHTEVESGVVANECKVSRRSKFATNKRAFGKGTVSVRTVSDA